MDFAFIIPGAGRSVIVGVLGDRLKVKVVAAPEDGKANKAVIALISEWLGADMVEIVSGHTHPEKVVRVRGVAKIGEDHLSVLK